MKGELKEFSLAKIRKEKLIESYSTKKQANEQEVNLFDEMDLI